MQRSKTVVNISKSLLSLLVLLVIGAVIKRLTKLVHSCHVHWIQPASTTHRHTTTHHDRLHSGLLLLSWAPADKCKGCTYTPWILSEKKLHHHTTAVINAGFKSLICYLVTLKFKRDVANFSTTVKYSTSSWLSTCNRKNVGAIGLHSPRQKILRAPTTVIIQFSSVIFL